MVFQGADATGFEADARLTAMWLWTLQAGDGESVRTDDDEAETEEEAESNGKSPKLSGYVL